MATSTNLTTTSTTSLVDPNLGDDRWWDWQRLAWQQVNLGKMELPDNVNDIKKGDRAEFNQNRVAYNNVLPFFKSREFVESRTKFLRVASSASNTSSEGFGIRGPAYGGKTTTLRQILFEYYVRQFGEPPKDLSEVPDDKTQIPVIWAQAAASRKSTLQQMLEFLNVPNTSGSAEELSRKLRQAVIKYDVKFIVLDDLHRLHMNYKKPEAGDVLKTLMDGMRRTTFLFTTTDTNDCQALNGRGSEQVRRRIVWHDYRPAAIKSESWKNAIEHWETHLPLCYDRNQGRLLEPLSGYLHARTHGHLGYLATLLKRGANDAIMNSKLNDERLTIEALNKVDLGEDAPPISAAA